MSTDSLSVEPDSVIETRLVHNVHRRATSVLAEAAGDPAAPVDALAELRAFLVGTLRHHHESEDDILWPLITSIAPAAANGLASLTEEHNRLDVALDALAAARVHDGADRGALREAATAVRDLVHRHLEHEEPLLFPALRAHVTAEAWEDFSRKIAATHPVDGAYLMLGFLDQLGTPDEVALITDHLPEPTRETLAAQREQARATLAALHADQ